MKLSLETVEHIADLARLSLSEEEKRQFTAQLSDILDYAARLEELDTDHIPPTASVLNLPLRLREDRATPPLPQAEVFRNAPQTRDGQFQVPPVLGD